MLIIGENINTSRRRIAEAVEKQDAAFIGQVAKSALFPLLDVETL